MLRVDPQRVIFFNQKLGARAYEKYFTKSIRDGSLDDSELRILKNLEVQLMISKEVIADIQKKSLDKFMGDFIQSILRNGRFSPDEQQEWQGLRNRLRWENFDVKIEEKLQQAKRNWKLENLELLPITTDVRLGKDEICFFEEYQITRHEYRSNRGEQYLKLIDTGNLYVTNKRVLFVGIEKIVSIKLQDILTTTQKRNYLEIKRSEGKNPFIESRNILGLQIVVNRILSGGYLR